MAADKWGTGAKTKRPAVRAPARNAMDPHRQRMAEIAWDAANAKKAPIEQSTVDRAAGKPMPGAAKKPAAEPAPTGRELVLAQGDEDLPRQRTDRPEAKETIEGAEQSNFFGPGQPMPPAAQDPRDGAVGRRYDYPVGYNQHVRARSTEQVSFNDLRLLADNLDILRLVIETRKDQMEALDWKFMPKDPEQKEVKNVEELEEFFRFPDKEHGYNEWMRALLEDLLVIDAPTIFPRLTNGGKLYSLDLIDGASIIPRIDATGRRPQPPDVAYQQVFKGMPAVDYSADDLLYRPRNVRTHKMYGFSPVEQVIITVNIALRRQQSLLQYYTSGSIPDAFGMVPENWSPGMIAEFQGHWDALFENASGTNDNRRKMRWIPGAKDIKFAKEAMLKDEFDEWLARIVCYCFSVEPTPFVRQMNRAVAETQRMQSRTEGLLPMKKWWKSLMDYLIQIKLQRPDVQFTWEDDVPASAKERMEVATAYVGAGVLTADEVREDLGYDPLPEKPPAQLGPDGQPIPPQLDANGKPLPPKLGPDGKPLPPPPPGTPGGPVPQPMASGSGGGGGGSSPPPGAGGGGGAAPPAEEDKAAKLRKARYTRAPDPDRRAALIQTQRLTRAIKREFRAQAKVAAERLGEMLAREERIVTTPDSLTAAAAAGMRKGPDPNAKARADKMLEDFAWQDQWGSEDWVDDVAYDPLMRMARDAAESGYASVGVSADPNFVDQWGVDDARRRGAEMVGMKYVDGKLVPNPKAEWVITEETRTGVRDKLEQALEEGWSVQRFQQELMDSYTFSPERAEAIARTEIAFADGRGHQAAYKESGVVEKKIWLVAPDEVTCEICNGNATQGPIDIDDEFASGDVEVPAHPNCRCAIAPYFDDDEELERAAGTKTVTIPEAPPFNAADLVKAMAKAIAGQPAPVINISPPAINIAPPAITVEGAKVDVHVPPAPAAKRFERVVTERDENQLIKRTEEREIIEPEDGKQYADGKVYKVVGLHKMFYVQRRDGTPVVGGAHGHHDAAVKHFDELEANLRG